MHKSEAVLVNNFVTALQAPNSPWGPVTIGREFQYDGGRTDVVAANNNGRLFAFEAKLFRWREALMQAYRASFFAHQSYVLLPEKTALIAGRYAGEFGRMGIGLCFVRGREIVVAIEAEVRRPLQTWLRNAAVEMIRGNYDQLTAVRGRRSGILRQQ